MEGENCSGNGHVLRRPFWKKKFFAIKWELAFIPSWGDKKKRKVDICFVLLIECSAVFPFVVPIPA